jgi:hypothetical protein
MTDTTFKDPYKKIHIRDDSVSADTACHLGIVMIIKKYYLEEKELDIFSSNAF